MKKDRTNRRIKDLGIEDRPRWKARGAGLINYHSRLLPQSPVSRELDEILTRRMNRG